MKIINRIISDFQLLSLKEKLYVFLAICMLYNENDIYHKSYMNQETPCKIMNEFVNIPLPDKDSIEIIPSNYNKLLIFSIKGIVQDPDKSYKDLLQKYMIEKKYKKIKNNVYEKEDLEIKTENKDELLEFRLYKPIKGIFVSANKPEGVE